MFDTHCHLTFDVFRDQVGEVCARARAAGVDGLITVGTTGASAREALAIARSRPDVWCSAGFHPLYAAEEADWGAILEVARDPRCVAWGELGLDNHYKEPQAERQRAVLDEQLALIERARAEGIAKPIIVHCREAFDELLDRLGAADLPRDRYVFHCFTGGPADARRVLDFGAWISFTGIVTFRNAGEIAEAAKIVPADRIMVETDAPFLTPEPYRKVWPNEPQYVVHTAKFLAELRGAEPGAFAAQLDANARAFFGIG